MESDNSFVTLLMYDRIRRDRWEDDPSDSTPTSYSSSHKRSQGRSLAAIRNYLVPSRYRSDVNKQKREGNTSDSPDMHKPHMESVPQTAPATQSSPHPKTQSIGRNSAISTTTHSTSITFSSSLNTCSFPDLTPSPILYPFDEISTAINDVVSSQPLSVSSWQSTLRNKKVVIICRQFHGHPIPASVLSTISRSHHRSLANLLGASLNNNHIYIVYEHIKGSNLKNCLQNPKSPSFTPLSKWIYRMQIIMDIAKGLEYIHDHCNMVHNNVKSTSVIVTEPKFKAKICLFGAANLTVAGDRVPSKKSDVSDFGIVILELISGKLMEHEGPSFIARARDAINNMKVRWWVDRRLRDSFPEEVVEKLIRLAVLQCMEAEEDKRPEMALVAGKIGKLFKDSEVWAEKFKFPTEFSASFKFPTEFSVSLVPR